MVRAFSPQQFKRGTASQARGVVDWFSRLISKAYDLILIDLVMKILRFVKDLLVKNWWLKLAAIVLAYALWLMVRGNEAERVFTVPLVVQIPRNMEIVNDRPSSVEIVARGSSQVGGLANLNYTIDLQTAGEGEHPVQLTTDGVRISPASGLEVIRVSPARITIVLERIISKDVPIRIPIQGSPAAGLELYASAFSPDTVRLTGPRSLIEPIKEVSTNPVSLEGQSRSFRAMVNFDIENADVHTNLASVEVNVELGNRRIAETYKTPVTVVDGDDFTVKPEFVSVIALVPVNLKEGIVAEDFQATVSARDSGTAQRRVAKVDVVYTKEPVAGFQIKEVIPEEIVLVRRSRKK